MGLTHSKKYPSIQTLEIVDENTFNGKYSSPSSVYDDRPSNDSSSESYSNRYLNRKIPIHRKRRKKFTNRHHYNDHYNTFESFDSYSLFPGVRFKSGKGKAVLNFGIFIRPISKPPSPMQDDVNEVCIYKIRHSKMKHGNSNKLGDYSYTKNDSINRTKSDSNTEYIGVPEPKNKIIDNPFPTRNMTNSSHLEYMGVAISKTDHLDTITDVSDINDCNISEDDDIPESIMLQNQNANNAEKDESRSSNDVNSILGQISKLNKNLLADNYSARSTVNDSKNRAKLSRLVDQVLKLLKKDETISSGVKSFSQADDKSITSRGTLLYKYESDSFNPVKTSETDSLFMGKDALKLVKIKGKKKTDYFTHNFLTNTLTDHLKKRNKTNKSVRFHKSAYTNSNDSKSKFKKCSYSFHTYFEPSKVDYGILPFRRHILAKKINSEPGKPKMDQIQDAYVDRRIKCVEKETKCSIHICELQEGVMVRGLPRRRVTINGPNYTAISKALVSLEYRLPELMENAVFKDALPIESKMWPSSKGDFVVRRFNSPFLFHKKCSASTRFDNTNWRSRILPHRVYPSITNPRDDYQDDEFEAEANNEEVSIKKSEVAPTKIMDVDDNPSSIIKDSCRSKGSMISKKSLNDLLQGVNVNAKQVCKDEVDNIEAIHIDMTDRFDYVNFKSSDCPMNYIGENDTNDFKSIVVSVSSSDDSASNTLDNFSSKNLLVSEAPNLAVGDVKQTSSPIMNKPSNIAKNGDFRTSENIAQSGDESCVLSSKSSISNSIIRTPLVYEYYNLSATIKRNYPYKKILSFPVNGATSFLLESSNKVTKNGKYCQFIDLQKSCGCQVEWIEPVTRFKSKKYLNMNVLYEDKQSLIEFSLRMGFKFKKMPHKLDI